VAFYAFAPLAALTLTASRPGAVIVCQSPYEAVGVLIGRRALPRSRRPRVVVEVHGDWHTVPRLYGSRLRRAVAPFADAAAAWAIRGADRVRTVGAFTERLAREAGYRGEVDRYPTFGEFDRYLHEPVAPFPTARHVVFVGVLERYKGPDTLVDAWNAVHRCLPDATLTVVGAGPMEARLRDRVTAGDLATSVRFSGHVDAGELVRLLDASRGLVLPSRSEGLPRAAMEAMARGRPVIGTRVGGTPELVVHGVTGLIVDVDDPDGLAAALVTLLEDDRRAATMGAEARRRMELLDPDREYKAGVARLAAWASAEG
jgi:glycosyltransferase involved in cell wall biosynthesis